MVWCLDRRCLCFIGQLLQIRERECLVEVFCIQTAGQAEISRAILDWHRSVACAEYVACVWISSHLRWFTERDVSISINVLKQTLLLPCTDRDRLLCVAPEFTFFDCNSVSIDVPFPVLCVPLRSDSRLRNVLSSLGVNVVPRIVKLECSYVRSPELIAVWNVMCVTNSSDLLKMLFLHWSDYRMSGEVLALVRDMKAPIFRTVLGDEIFASWFLVLEKDVALPEELSSALPFLSCDLGVHRDAISADLGIKSISSCSAATRFGAMQEWLIRHKSASLKMWHCLYKFAHSHKLPCGTWVFAPEEVVNESVFETMHVLNAVALSSVVWDGVPAISRWASQGSVVLSSLYPNLKSFFCPPVLAFPSVQTVVACLCSTWLDLSGAQKKCRKVTETSLVDIAKLYEMCSEY
jgi:hypothetical protein